MTSSHEPAPPHGLPCVHCGLCLDTCPTYRVLGVEADSPRGRIYIMEAVKRGRLALGRQVTDHLDGCLGCLACETACPSGVSYKQRVEQFRPLLVSAPRGPGARLRRSVSRRVATSERLVRLAVATAGTLDAVGLSAMRRRLPGLGLVPKRRPATRARVPTPTVPRLRVALLGGCVADLLHREISDAAVDVLHRNAIEVVDLAPLGCCGALALHSGRFEEAHALAQANARAFARSGLDAIVTTAAGCGAILKDYDRLLADDPAAASAGRTLAAAAQDVSELLVAAGFREPRASGPRGAVAYHDACHLLHARSIYAQPRRITRAAIGHDPPDLGENAICCGSAGSYNLDEPKMASTLGARKAALVSALGAATVAVANVGCIMQMERALALAGVAAEVKHPVELLADAYAREDASNSRR